MSWEQFLSYLSEPNGVLAVVGVALSWIIEWWPQYGIWSARAKRLTFLLLCLLIPLVAAVLRWLTGIAELTWAGLLWPALVAGGTAFAAGTVAHTRKLK